MADGAAVGWTVHHAVLDDVLHQQFEQASARLEGMSHLELLAFRELCNRMTEMVNDGIASCEAQSA